MDPRRRRRATAAAAGLTCLLAVGLAGAAILLRTPGADAAGRLSGVPGFPGSTHAAAARKELFRPRVAVDPALSGLLRERIGEAKDRAARETKGRVSPGEVSVAVHVREVGADGDLVSLGSDRPMRPASNLKLVTTAAALVLLGVDWRFETVLESEAAVEGGVLRGDLVARAAGDPLYRRGGDGSVESLLEPVADALRARGIRAIDGALVLDELDYAAPAAGPGWPDAGQRWSEFCALAGGFSANAGCLTATVEATSVGESARVAIEPRSFGLPRRGRVETAVGKSRLDVRVDALNGAAYVAGSIPLGAPAWSTRFAAPDPVELFGNALAGALARRGIELRGGWRRGRAALTGRWTELARISTPLRDVLPAINSDSNNACADQLFLALGHAHGGAGTREGGGLAVARALERLGVRKDGLVQVDGSGLSRDDRVTARQITALLDAVLSLDERTAAAFLDSLAVGGESGTLEDRMRNLSLQGGSVRGKTGFIAGTSALSGVLDTRDGRRLAFSILVEYPPTDGLNSSCWKPMQDRICAELAGADG